MEFSLYFDYFYLFIHYLYKKENVFMLIYAYICKYIRYCFQYITVSNILNFNTLSLNKSVINFYSGTMLITKSLYISLLVICLEVFQSIM